MGLNYSYILMIDKAERANLQSLIEKRCQRHKGESREYLMIDLPLDDAISMYLREDIQRDEGLKFRNTLFFKKSKYRDHFPTDQTGRIGAITFELLEDTHQTFAIFMAVSTRISYLFLDSKSVRDWFIQLSKDTHAMATFIDLEDMEDMGCRFVYKNNEVADILIKEGNATNDTECLAIHEQYLRLVEEQDRLLYGEPEQE
ncbi:MAG: hypothetical protein HOP30_02755 [Cyclobacteriaceae bacterium]|nr:hypothetical protein [Cyclobacteriaceae bacterium]